MNEQDTLNEIGINYLIFSVIGEFSKTWIANDVGN
jgi:hypothetical protein